MSAPVACAVHRVDVPGSTRPPVVLVHGAANSAGVWTFWQHELARRGWSSCAIDLRGHGASERIDLSRTGMQDYADDVSTLCRTLGEQPVLMGWSMGGLVALMSASASRALACVGLAPSTPASATDPSSTLREGVFGPEEYGITSRDPKQQPAMSDLALDERRIAIASLGMESRLARDERAAGVVVDGPRCPVLILTGSADTQWPAARYRGLPIAADLESVEGAPHWGLVLARKSVAAGAEIVGAWLDRAIGRTSA